MTKSMNSRAPSHKYFIVKRRSKQETEIYFCGFKAALKHIREKLPIDQDSFKRSEIILIIETLEVSANLIMELEESKYDRPERQLNRP